MQEDFRRFQSRGLKPH